MKTVQDALQCILDNSHLKSLNYCANYARVALTDLNKTQLLYVLTNMQHWRGPQAKAVRSILKGATS